MQIIVRRYIASRGLPDILANARKENEARVNTLRNQNLVFKTLFHESDPIGLEVSLGDFRVDREIEDKDLTTHDKKLKYSIWSKIPSEVIPKSECEYWLECREYAPQHNYNKIFCTPDGKELTEEHSYGPNYASYLNIDEAVEVVIKNKDYLKINRCFIDFSPQGDSVRVSKLSIWKGPLMNYPKNVENFSIYNLAIERCLINMKQKQIGETIPIIANK